MSFCFFHQPALRRHLDDGQPLSARAQAHLGHCRDCREMVRSHLAIIQHLSAKSGEPTGAPPFLHARVMEGLREQTRVKAQLSFAPRWAIAMAAVATIALLIAFLSPRHSI